MADLSPRLSRREAFAGVAAGLLLALIAWVSSGAPSAFLSGHLSPDAADAARRSLPGAAAVLPTAAATPLPPTDCVAPATSIASIGFDPYAILLQKRPDVLAFYAQNGWNPAVQCIAIYDSWTKAGAGGKQSTPPAASVKAPGWAPAAPAPTPAPPADCAAPASEAAQLGFDPYQILALHRPDVLNLYKLNGWNPDTQCVKLFDNWLQHPDGGPPANAAAFVVGKGWATGHGPSVAPISAASALPLATPSSSVTPAPAATPMATAVSSPTASPAPTFLVPPTLLPTAAVIAQSAATPLPATACAASAHTIASIGFDPFVILLQKRPDVVQFYARNGWNPAVQCTAIYDNWTSNGAGGSQPTTPAAYVQAQGWAPAAPVSAPAPPADCRTPASEGARLGYDPYRILAADRPDVLNFYQFNGWNPDIQCVQLLDDWLQRPDGGPPTTAAAFDVSQGWIEGRTASGVPTYTVQPGDTLFVIAQRFQVSLAALQRANGIANPDAIQAGQVLRLPIATPTP
ncbi:MAG TPA: LysM domain-containing protein [Chloroflexota bacterium]|nr:LysM domain-containing protein [Chloroflexota bacterium]